MPFIRGIGVGLVAIALVLILAASRSATATEVLPASASQVLQSSDEVIWGRVAYCNCFATSATANVANALKEANLTVSLKEQSPRDGWLYFAVTFDPTSATLSEVNTAIKAGGGEVLEGPP